MMFRPLTRSPILAPDATLALVPRPRAARVIARLLGGLFLATVLALALLPWQQSVTGTGRVIAYAPLDRQQEIKATIAGRVVEWHVQEGDRVVEGQLIATIEDNDPQLRERLGLARDAAGARLESARESVRVYGDQITALVTGRTAAIEAASHRIDMAIERLRAAEKALDAAIATNKANELNLERQRALEAEGIASSRTLELAVLAAETSRADVDRASATMRAAKGEIASLRSERDRTDASTSAEIERARASLQSARADLASYDGMLQDREVAVSRQDMMKVTAPRAGTILAQRVKAGAEYVSAGESIATLVPSNGARAVEIWLDGRDAPLVTPGRHVRLQFEGWPAVQFVGWPSVAVGTFGGKVAFVDSAANPLGQFRVVVVPEDPGTWPSENTLRQGARVNGWVLLDRVKLGYELWRQWNGFPPATTPPPEESGTAKATAKGPTK